jgi:hypothetical protein
MLALLNRPGWPVGLGSNTVSGEVSTREEICWVGKPWRRVELLTQRYFWNGVETEVNRTLTVHLGWPRFGLSVSLTLSRDHYDYSEERP